MNDQLPATDPAPLWQRLVVGRRPAFTLIRAVVVALVAWGLFSFVLVPIRVRGLSMAPNYRDGRVNLVNKLAYRHNPPQRGDVVAVRLRGDKVFLLKRVIGLPGERVLFKDGAVFINGQRLEEPYLRLKPAPWNGQISLGSDQYYVVGDNRQMAPSQHEQRVCRRNQILGKVVF